MSFSLWTMACEGHPWGMAWPKRSVWARRMHPQSTGESVLRLHSCRALSPDSHCQCIAWRACLPASGCVAALARGKRAGRLLAMQDIALYQQILGLEEPWKVKEVKLDMTAREVVVE